VEDRADCLARLGVEPWIEPFRSDPRYGELLREVGPAPGTPRGNTSLEKVPALT
jgi:hypothetical protein